MPEPDLSEVPDSNAVFEMVRRHFAALYGLDHPPIALTVQLRGLEVPHTYAIPPARSLVTHSADFGIVKVGAETYTFTPLQRAAIAFLWLAHVNGRRAVAQAEILKACGSDQARLDHLFLSPADHGKRMHPAWGVLVIAAGKGQFFLDLP